jgi:sterol desaturase/sphingolipid hydroxylase (fatty acid hydroxylase superfamily)
MLLDAEQLHRLYDKLWAFFVDGRILGQSSLALLGALLVLAAELPFREWNKTAMYRLFVQRSMSAKVDIVVCLLQFIGVSTLASMAFTFGLSIVGVRLANMASDYLSWARITLPDDGILQITFSFFVYWLVQNLFSYWTHRLYHAPPFWNLHRFHHAATELNFITMWRFHPGEPVLLVLTFLSPLVIIKASDSILVVAITVSYIVNFCQHSDINWDWGWLGRWIFGSPYVHQLHHSIDAEHQGKNFSACPLWDHVFGTWYAGDKRPSAYGALNHAYDQQPWTELMRDTWRFYSQFAILLLWPIRKMTAARISPGGDVTPDWSAVTLGEAKESSGA